MSGRAGMTATLERSAQQQGRRTPSLPAPATAYVIRIGDLVLPVVRPVDADVVELAQGSRLGSLALRSVRWPGAGELAPPGGGSGGEPDTARSNMARPAVATESIALAPRSVATLDAVIDAPFVTGSARIELAADGEPSGLVRLEAAIGLPGAPMAAFDYATTAWTADARLPVPAVSAGRDALVVEVGDIADIGNVRVTGPGVAEGPVGRWSVPLPAAFLSALGTSPEAPAVNGAVGADPMAAARASLAAEPSERQPLPDPARTILEALLGIDLAAIAVHVDPPAQRAASAAGVAAFTLGPETYFAAGRFGIETAELAALLARAVSQAVEGMTHAVTLDEPMADPAQAASRVPAAPSVEAAQPVPPGPTPVAAEVPIEEAAAPVGEPGAAPEGALPEAAAGEAPAAAGEAAAEEGAVEEAAAPIELIMPPAPAEPGPAQQERMGGVRQGAGRAARRAADLPDAGQTTAEARGAVEEPAAETVARAEAAVAQALGKRAEPSPEIVALCENIRTSIRERRPANEDEVEQSDSQRVAREAGQALSGDIQEDAQEVEGSYAPLSNPPAGAPALSPNPIETPPTTVQPPAIGAEGAAPDPIPDENLSLEADRDATAARVEESRINRPSAEPIQEPPFTTVREGQAELDALSESGPAQVAAQQQEAIDRSQADMATLQLQAVEALNASRSSTVGRVSGGQNRMVGSEAQQREQISQQASAIFQEAQTGVTAVLAPLQANAMAQWDAGVQHLSTEFHDHLAMVRRWIDERHEGIGGWFVSGWDSLTGLPDEITDEYTKAERQFGDGICELLLRISSDVNTVIAAAEALIASARERIDVLFRDLPAGLRDWAAQEQARFHGQLDGLQQQAAEARTSFVDDVSHRAVTAVAEVQAEVEQLREEAKGLIGKIADAIRAFIDDPIKAIIDGLLHLVGIPPPRFWALVEKIAQVIGDIADDPMGFANHLVEAVKLGFQQFFDNFGTHVLQGFWEWLFSGLGSVGVQLPKDMSVGSLMTFALQVMGITWPNIRKILVKYIGEENVALIEQAWQLVSVLIEKGPSGIFEMIKERLAPEVLLETILKAAVDYLVDALIKQITIRVIGLLNPVGAIAQAIQLIYTVLKWIFQNAARIFSLIETVVGAMADVIAGNLAAVANAVEKALAMLIPPVIDFFAEWLGFGDLPIKIADVIKSLQEQVLAVIDQIIGWLVEQAKALLAAVGLGGDEDEEGAPGAEDLELGKVVPFRAAGESHAVSIDQETGEVMVASVPTKVSDKLAEWSGKVDTLRGEKQTRGITLLSTADQLVTQANSEAANLAPGFEAAKTAATPEQQQPPSDSGVEAKEDALATTLRALYEVFGEKPDLTTTFEAELNACHASAKDDVAAGLVRLGREQPELDLAEWPSVRTALASVGGPISRSLEEPMHAGSGGYSTAGHGYGLTALDRASTSPKAPVKSKTPEGREQYLVSQKRYIKRSPTAPFELAYAALQDSIFGGPDPTNALEQAFRQKFEASTEPDEALQEAVTAVGGVVNFLRALARGRVFLIDIPEFERLWAIKVNMDYIKGLFRDVPTVGSHEWIPTNLIPEVVQRARTPKEGEQLFRWVDVQNEMRTDTSWVIFSPSYAKASLTPPGRPTMDALTGHAGALYYRFAGEPRGHPLTTAQKRWHDLLRVAFRGKPDPASVVTEMESITQDTVWRGDVGQAAGFYDPYYTKESEEDTGAVTLVELGGRQAPRFQQLIEKFEEWRARWAS